VRNPLARFVAKLWWSSNYIRTVAALLSRQHGQPKARYLQLSAGPQSCCQYQAEIDLRNRPGGQNIPIE